MYIYIYIHILMIIIIIVVHTYIYIYIYIRCAGESCYRQSSYLCNKALLRIRRHMLSWEHQPRQNTESGAGEQFLLLDCRIRVRVKRICVCSKTPVWLIWLGSIPTNRATCGLPVNVDIKRTRTTVLLRTYVFTRAQRCSSYVCVCVCTYAYMYIRYIYIYIHTYIRISYIICHVSYTIYHNTYMYVHTYICTCIYIYIYADTYMYTHTYICRSCCYCV